MDFLYSSNKYCLILASSNTSSESVIIVFLIFNLLNVASCLAWAVAFVLAWVIKSLTDLALVSDISCQTSGVTESLISDLVMVFTLPLSIVISTLPIDGLVKIECKASKFVTVTPKLPEISSVGSWANESPNTDLIFSLTT